MTASSSPDVEAPELRRELVEMRDEEQRVRHSIELDDEGSPVDADAIDEMRSMEKRHAERLEAILDELGRWPGFSLVGEAGSDAAWTLAQHADHDIKLQERCLDLLGEAVERDEASQTNYAYLADCVRLNLDDKQIYGTHLAIEDGEVEPFPVEDRENLDDRREETGLRPFETYVEDFKESIDLE